VFVATLAHDRRSFPWRAWLWGSALGTLTLLPWLEMLWAGVDGVATKHARSLRFFSELVQHGFGLGLRHPLGGDFKRFLEGPRWFDVPTQLNALARYGLWALIAYGLIVHGFCLRTERRLRVSQPLGLYAFCVVLAGLAMIAAGVKIHAHYLIVFGPRVHMAAAWLLFPRRAALVAVCALQAFLSVNFLAFIHQRGGAPGADYGRTYSAQSRDERGNPDELPQRERRLPHAGHADPTGGHQKDVPNR
jgi:hypothetical protein